jgi:hypothetical protein
MKRKILFFAPASLLVCLLVFAGCDMGLGTSGGKLIINAPGKTVTVKSIDCEDGALSEIHVIAGTLAITDEGGLTNTTGTTITVESGASFTINNVEYSE